MKQLNKIISEYEAQKKRLISKQAYYTKYGLFDRLNQTNIQIDTINLKLLQLEQMKSNSNKEVNMQFIKP